MAMDINPSKDQYTTLIIILVYSIVILLLWNLPYLKNLLYPFKIITVGLHEFSHAVAGIITGAKISSIEVNPNEGGVTKLSGGNQYVILPAGYLGSSIWGSIMIMMGFNTLGSKIISILIGLIMLIILWYSNNWFTRFITILMIGLIIFLWWFEKGKYIRYFVLFMGVMSALYSLYDVIEDLIMRKVNSSDATKFSKLCCKGLISPRIWGLIWFLISLIFLVGSILLGLIIFDQTDNSYDPLIIPN